MKITLDEAIQHAEEVAKALRAYGCTLCAEEHEQLASWLRELMRLKALVKSIELVNTD
jgi:hypothetical protein